MKGYRQPELSCLNKSVAKSYGLNRWKDNGLIVRFLGRGDVSWVNKEPLAMEIKVVHATVSGDGTLFACLSFDYPPPPPPPPAI